MSVEHIVELKTSRVDELKVDGDYYSVCFGMGRCIKLIDDPKVFKVSCAGIAFGSLLARYMTKEYLGSRFLDVGTGSGVHSLLLRSMGVDSITGTDISKEAISAAKINELKNFELSTINFISGDLFQSLPDMSEKYDFILFNSPGWRTPSQSFLDAIDRSVGIEGLSIDSMFYGDSTLERFFEKLTNYLAGGGRVLLGLNSLVGIRQALDGLRKLHEKNYVINCRFLEKHDFPLLFYTEKWSRVQEQLISEIMRWTKRGDAYCSVQEDGRVVWSYEIFELTLRRR